jgi:integrative and conjugative element protein (TIGR02256 family)
VDLFEWFPIGQQGIPSGVAPAILLSYPMPFEFPTKVSGLIDSIEARGIPCARLLALLQYALLHNEKDTPLYMVLGTPMRGVRGSSELKQHLTVWYIEPIVATGLRIAIEQYNPDPQLSSLGKEAEQIILDWAKVAEVSWCYVREDRPEIVTRRDSESSTAWFADRHVAIWGCGALGGHVAEFLARSGVRKLTLHDRGTVSPGVLIRQPFDDLDVGREKVFALADRLHRIRPNLEILTSVANLLSVPLDTPDWTEGVDVVIDASASQAVLSKAELRRRQSKAATVPVVSMVIGHTAQSGLVVVVGPKFSGGPFDASRRAKLEACNRAETQDFSDEFWPANRRPFFQPEPGCSDPTFIGSAADVASLAGSMLNAAAFALRDMEGATARAIFVGSPSYPAPRLGPITFSWNTDQVVIDPHTQYEIRICRAALAEISAWLNRSRRTSGPRPETGGLLFGERDDALKIIWVTEITGPPPDSDASEAHFVCGIEGTREAHTEKIRRSRNSVGYIGMWHTHPEQLPTPSLTDLGAMERLLSATAETPSKSLLLIVGGRKEDPDIGAYVFSRREFAEIRDRGSFERQRLVSTIRSEPIAHSIGLTLSGGGSRAIAFHLGCLRALHDRGILPQIEIISAVSGGALIAALYAYGQGSFAEFESRVIDLLKRGLVTAVARRLFVPPRAIGCLFTGATAGVAALAAYLLRLGIETGTSFLPADSRAARHWSSNVQPPCRRWTSRTVAFEAALRDLLFQDQMITSPRRDQLNVVFNACELRTGTAFRFGSRESACWRFGKLKDNDVPLSLAVAASAAYPSLLPAIDREFNFVDRKCNSRRERVILTDGGVYDNLGLSCLEPGRSDEFSSNVFNPEYIICCDAGPGQFEQNVLPYWWPSRMKRAFETTFRRNVNANYTLLQEWNESRKIKGFVLSYLGQQDQALPYIPPDLIRRENVIAYPTDFSPMSNQDIQLIGARGEQLTRLLISRYAPEL